MVYRDLNTSGVYDAGDTLYSGVSIKITDGTGALIAAATSNSSGIYNFRGVPDGNFTLAVDLTTVNTGWISIPPSRARTVTRTSNVIGLDFGLQPPSAHVGGQIYADLNANNVFDSATESPLSGVTITLTPSGGAAISTASNADGNYTFSNLSTGSYTLAVVGGTLPAGHAIPNSVALTITQTSNITYNFAVRVNSLAGITYRDLNHNGLYDAGDQPYSGVAINLTNSNGGLVATATTDSTGAYKFRGLAAGTYTLTPDSTTYTAGWISSPATRIRSVTITSNVTALDFGLQPPVATIAGSVFADLDSNNIIDGSDYGLQGLIVTLTANSNGSTTTQTTDATGNYAFTNLATGSYSVAIDPANLPSGYNSLFTGTFTLGQNSNITFNLPLRLNGLVGVAYRDLNSNAVNDAGDQPYAGIVVQLTNSNGAPVGTTTTDSTGTYSFRGLVADTYTTAIDMTTVDAGWASVPTSRIRTLTNTANLTGLDFALQPPNGQINGKVFLDVDGNGVYDGSDTPMAGVAVKLQRPDNSIITASTDATGMYNFSSLSNGNHVISVDAASLPVGHYSLLASRTVAISGNTINDMDFSIRRNSVTGLLFTDNDRNRRYGAGDTLLANVVVKLRPTAGGPSVTSTTDAGGNYLFRGIADGSYVLTVDAVSLPVGHFSKIASQSVTIQTTSQMKKDFPIWTNDVGGTVFLDLDKDRVYDRPGDQALGNVTLILTLPGGSTRTTTTLGSGSYRFNALAPGTYTVTIDGTTLPNGTSNAKGTWTITVANGTYKLTYHFWVWQTAQAN